MNALIDKPPAKHAPWILGGTLIALGLGLRQFNPVSLKLPEESDAPKRDRGAKKAARMTRDGLTKFMPRHMNESLGNSLMFVGGSLLAIRLLDEIVEESERIF